jgi:hypothetical protein
LAQRAASRPDWRVWWRSQAGHGGGAVVAPQLGGVVLTHDGQQLGIELIDQREGLGQNRIVDGQIKPFDGAGEIFEDAADLPRHDL